jgi:hypothetical protein
MGLPETGKFPTGGGNQGNADPARIMPTVPAGGTPASGATTTTTTNAQTTNASNMPAPVEVPVTPTAGKKEGQVTMLKTPFSEFSALNPSSNTETGNARFYETLDGEAKKHIVRLFETGSDLNNSNFMQPIKEVLKYSDDPRFEKVMSILSGKGILSGLATLAQSGIGLSAGDWNAQLKIDLDRIAHSIQDDNLRAFGQNVFRSLAKMELNNQKAMGLNPSTARNAEFGLIANAVAHPDTLPSAACLYAKQAELNQLRVRDLYKDTEDLIHRRHKKYVIDPDSPTKQYLIMTSPSQKSINEQYDSAYDREMDKYIKSTSGGKK